MNQNLLKEMVAEPMPKSRISEVSDEIAIKIYQDFSPVECVEIIWSIYNNIRAHLQEKLEEASQYQKSAHCNMQDFEKIKEAFKTQ